MPVVAACCISRHVSHFLVLINRYAAANPKHTIAKRRLNDAKAELSANIAFADIKADDHNITKKIGRHEISQDIVRGCDAISADIIYRSSASTVS